MTPPPWSEHAADNNTSAMKKHIYLSSFVQHTFAWSVFFSKAHTSWEPWRLCQERRFTSRQFNKVVGELEMIVETHCTWKGFLLQGFHFSNRWDCVGWILVLFKLLVFRTWHPDDMLPKMSSAGSMHHLKVNDLDCHDLSLERDGRFIFYFFLNVFLKYSHFENFFLVI